MELSKRMKNNACLVDQGSMAADIGCDHGYVSIFLVQERKCKKVIAMDIGKGPLSQAQKNIEAAGLQDKIQCRLSNGMEKLTPGNPYQPSGCDRFFENTGSPAPMGL